MRHAEVAGLHLGLGDVELEDRRVDRRHLAGPDGGEDAVAHVAEHLLAGVGDGQLLADERVVDEAELLGEQQERRRC